MALPDDKEIPMIKELRERVGPMINEDERESDMFFVRWLRARDHNIVKAEEMLKNSIEWKDKKGYNEIVKNWKEPEVFKEYYPFGISGYDDEGRPIIIVPMGRLDLRGLLEAAGQEAFVNKTIQVIEKIMKAMKEKEKEIKKPVTQFSVIIDCEHLSWWQITYTAAADMVLKLIRIYEKNFPETLKVGYVVNAPRIFASFFNLIKPLLSKDTISKIEIYGFDSAEWKEKIFSNIPLNQVPKHWGGTLEGNDEFCSEKISMGGIVPDKYRIQPLDESENDGLILADIAAGQKLEIEFFIEEPNSTLKWTVKVEAYDILFSVSYEDESVIVPPKKIDVTSRKVEGSYKCTKPGKYMILCDNSFSYLRSKTVRYFASVISEKGEIIDATFPG